MEIEELKKEKEKMLEAFHKAQKEDKDFDVMEWKLKKENQ